MFSFKIYCIFIYFLVSFGDFICLLLINFLCDIMLDFGGFGACVSGFSFLVMIQVGLLTSFLFFH